MSSNGHFEVNGKDKSNSQNGHTTNGTEKESGAASSVREGVQNYYGKQLKTTEDLKSNVCSVGRRNIPCHLRQIMNSIHPDIQAKYFGCGLIAPTALEGCKVLDLGCGAGMDCFILSRLVGPTGHVTGLDMTDEQLDIARKYVDHHTKEFGYECPNVDFTKGFIENLTDAGLPDSHFNIIISNCVINLSPSKKQVLQEAYEVLKPGGEMFFSDMYVDKAVPEHFREREDLWGEGIAGALSWKELHGYCREIGFCEPRLFTASTFTFTNQNIINLTEGYNFVSATFRLFKLPTDAEKMPSLVTYNGRIPHQAEEMVFDHKYTFKPDQPQEVDGELAAILQHSRFGPFFTCKAADSIANPFTYAQTKTCKKQSCQ